MAEVRLGRQTPTRSVILPYEKSKGKKAIQLYNKTKKKALDWQKKQIEDILAVDERGDYVHIKYGLSVPRRNGKNEVILMRELYALEVGEYASHTAHRTKTATSSWERLCKAVRDAGYEEGVDFKTTNRTGMESVRFLKTGGRVDFSTRSSQGGLGEGFDVLIIDEAQEYTEDQETALKYTVSASPNPQTILTGTPPTTVSKGTVFPDYRKAVLAGDRPNSGWAEWSVPELSDVRDKDLWYETNPSLGTILKEIVVADEISSDDIDFNIQRLGHWLQYNQKSAISRATWEDLTWTFDRSELNGSLFVGIKYAVDSTNVSMGIAVRTSDGIFVEAIDCRPIREGNDWIIRFLSSSQNVARIVIDGAGKQDILAKELREAGVHKVILPTVKEYVVANALFTQMIEDGVICHTNQPSLTQAVTNCERRLIGNKGGYGFQSLREGIDISLMDSVILASWICSETKTVRKKQRIRY